MDPERNCRVFDFNLVMSLLIVPRTRSYYVCKHFAKYKICCINLYLFPFDGSSPYSNPLNPPNQS